MDFCKCYAGYFIDLQTAYIIWHKQMYEDLWPMYCAVVSEGHVLIFQGGSSSAQKYLDKFMKAIESYFHPANFGRWLVKLKDLLRKLPYYFVQRLHTLVDHCCPLLWVSTSLSSLFPQSLLSFLFSVHFFSFLVPHCLITSSHSWCLFATPLLWTMSIY
jgi:hypothetical protein